jgi:hypothetical protein
VVICIFLDGPIAGDVRTDFPPMQYLRIPVPARETWCDCNPDHTDVVQLGPEIVEYRALMHGERVVVYSCKADAADQVIMRMLENWMVSDLGNPKWVRHCRDRRAFT